jgi:hypothetical protein
MGTILAQQNISDEEDLWDTPAEECHKCGDPICYADECVLVRCTFPKTRTLGSGLTWQDLPNPEAVGLEPIAPIIFETMCWEEYADDLRTYVIDTLGIRPRPATPSEFICTFCRTHIGLGEYCGHIIYGEIAADENKTTIFKPAPGETIQNAELICTDCLAWINAECDENMWPELWLET